MNVYVYYDVPLAARAETASKVRAMQHALAGRAQRIALLRRPETKPDRQTWMEVYENVADGFETSLADAVAAHALVSGPRHVERFVPVD